MLGRYFRGSGTSFAAPQVAGAAALLLQQRPTLSNNHVKAMLVRSAVDLPGVPASAQGAGALNIPALLATGPTTPANTGVIVPTGTGTVTLSAGQLSQTVAHLTNSWDTNSWDTNSWDTNSWDTNSWDTNSWDTNSWDTNSWDTNSWDTNSWD